MKVSISCVVLLNVLILSISLPGRTDSGMVLGRGDHELSLKHNGLMRTYIVHVPPQAESGKPLPVVLNFHGGGVNAGQQKSSTQMDQVADREGFLVVYPNGTGRLPRILTWNAGKCCGFAQTEQIDDVGFVIALLDELDRVVPVDGVRVYATGLSNGAMMAYRLAVEASDRFAAIAPVAGSMMVDSFKPTRPVSIMHIHSVDDPRALYHGGLGPTFPWSDHKVNHNSVEETLGLWVTYNGCSSKPHMAPTIHGQKGAFDELHSATKYTYGPGRNGTEVVLWKFSGAGHVWPGATYPKRMTRVLGPSTSIIDANEEMWAFFSRFSLTSARNDVR